MQQLRPRRRRAVSRRDAVAAGQGVEFVFTMFQFDGMPDEVWHGQMEELSRELARLKQAVEAS